MVIKIYVIDKSDGSCLYEDTGNPEYVIADLGDDKDFTLTPPPDNSKQWRWVDGQWVQEVI